jgi:hypothetical protein
VTTKAALDSVLRYGLVPLAASSQQQRNRAEGHSAHNEHPLENNMTRIRKTTKREKNSNPIWGPFVREEGNTIVDSGTRERLKERLKERRYWAQIAELKTYKLKTVADIDALPPKLRNFVVFLKKSVMLKKAAGK